MSIPNPEKYLIQAEHLIGWAGGGQAEYRRAISTAYYAVFHTVLRSVADHYIGRGSPERLEYKLAYRHIDHSTLSQVCTEFKKRLVPDDLLHQDLRAFASAVVELQSRRHRADYDPDLDLRASDTRAAVRSARDAIDRFRRLQQDQRLKFLFHLMVKVKERR